MACRSARPTSRISLFVSLCNTSQPAESSSFTFWLGVFPACNFKKFSTGRISSPHCWCLFRNFLLPVWGAVVSPDNFANVPIARPIAATRCYCVVAIASNSCRQKFDIKIKVSMTMIANINREILRNPSDSPLG